MSNVSQAPAQQAPAHGRGWSWGRRALIGAAIVAAILAIALRGAGGVIADKIAHAHVHGPDLALWASLPLAIKLHIAGALTGLLLGAFLMLHRKGRLVHRVGGWIWVAAVTLVAGSSIFIGGLIHGKPSVLHLFTGWTLIILPLAVTWAKRHEVARHRRFMMGLFYGGFAVNIFIAFIPGRTMWNLFFG